MLAYEIFYTVSGSVIVHAESVKEARKIAEKKNFPTEPSTEEITNAEVNLKETKKFRKWGKS
jgi:hypothetical protein